MVWDSNGWYGLLKDGMVWLRMVWDSMGLYMVVMDIIGWLDGMEH
jgi:hypothetical protein